MATRLVAMFTYVLRATENRQHDLWNETLSIYRQILNLPVENNALIYFLTYQVQSRLKTTLNWNKK